MRYSPNASRKSGLLEHAGSIMKQDHMHRSLLAGVAALALAVATQNALAADLPTKTLPTKAPQLAAPYWSWAGWYGGVHAGAMWSGTRFADPYGPSIFGDLVAVPGYLTGAQIGYNWQSGNIVFGLEADGSLVSSDGSNTCLQFTGIFVGSNCKAKVKDLASFTGRLGLATGPLGHTLVYAKGGLAWVRNEVSINPNNEFGNARAQPDPTTLHYSRWGWTVGAGVEHAMTPAWSLKLEYDYYRFGDESITTPEGFRVTPDGRPFAVASLTSNISQDAHVFKIGTNYKFGADPWARWDSAPGNMFVKAPRAGWAPGWEVDLGARYWYSSGKFQWDNFASANILQSRLTYDKLRAHSGEVFGRIDSPWNFFAKGVVGGGRITGGHMNDEDWGVPSPIDGGVVFTSYTNTLSEPVKGPMRYANIDVGYDLTRGPGYKAGAFIGYHYSREVMNAFGCTQTVAPAPPFCVPPFPPGFLGITQTAKWQGLRLGFAGEVMVWDRLRLNGEVAYLPWVKFNGRDDHHARDVPTFFSQSGDGHGVQTEVVLSYLLTDQFSIGVGGRYWAMWTTDGQFTCTGCSGAGVTNPPSPFKGNTERFGTFLQGSYRW